MTIKSKLEEEFLEDIDKLFTGRVRDILKKRYEQYTLREIGKTYGLSGERIRRIQKRAINHYKWYLNSPNFEEAHKQLYLAYPVYIRKPVNS